MLLNTINIGDMDDNSNVINGGQPGCRVSGCQRIGVVFALSGVKRPICRHGQIMKGVFLCNFTLRFQCTADFYIRRLFRPACFLWF